MCFMMFYVFLRLFERSTGCSGHGTLLSARSPRAADVNGDGRVDLVLGGVGVPVDGETRACLHEDCPVYVNGVATYIQLLYART